MEHHNALTHYPFDFFSGLDELCRIGLSASASQLTGTAQNQNSAGRDHEAFCGFDEGIGQLHESPILNAYDFYAIPPPLLRREHGREALIRQNET
jgi:hypothetical protein